MSKRKSQAFFRRAVLEFYAWIKLLDVLFVCSAGHQLIDVAKFMTLFFPVTYETIWFVMKLIVLNH